MKRFAICLILVSYSTIYSQNAIVQDWTLNFPPRFDYNNFYVVDMEKDNTGNMYLTGYLLDNIPGNSDIILLKIVTSSFLVEWIVVYNGPANGDDLVDDLEIDKEGNCIVAGLTYIGNNNSDYVTIKYNPSGQQIWENTYSGSANHVDWINDLLVDNAGNVYVTGASREESYSYNNATTIKYNANGVMEWKATHDNSTNFDEEGRGLVVDNSGNVYMACKTYTTSVEFLTIKYNSVGVEQWTRLACSTTQNEWAQFIGLDNSGKVTIGGTAYEANPPPYDPIGYYMIKYNPDGSFAGGGNTYNSSSVMRGMVVSPQGNVYVTGESSGANQSRDFVTVKFNSSGYFEWVKRFNYAEYDRPRNIIIDEDENIFITGYSTNTTPSFQNIAVTVKYNSSGDSLWTNIYTHQNYQSNAAGSIILDESGDIYVAINYNSGTIEGNEILKINSSGT